MMSAMFGINHYHGHSKIYDKTVGIATILIMVKKMDQG